MGNGWRRRVGAVAIAAMLLALPQGVRGHAGHGDEFSDRPVATGPKAIAVEPEVAARLGIVTEPVVRRSRPQGLVLNGQVEPLPGQEATVTAPVDGRILAILVTPGDRVVQGQPVAMLLSHEINELQTEALDRRAEAQDQVRQAQVALDLARKQVARLRTIAAADLSRAQGELATAQERFDRDRDLTEAGALPRRQALETEDALARARAEVTHAQAQVPVLEAESAVERAEADLTLAQERLQLSDRTYRTRLAQLATGGDRQGRVSLRAPIAGVVATVSASPGETVEVATKVILTITNGARVAVTANLPEGAIGSVRPGQAVRVTAASLGQGSRTGTVTRVGAAVNASQRTVPVQATITNGDGVLKPGMFATVELQTGQGQRPILAVPEGAIVTADGQALIFVENGTAQGKTQYQAVPIERGAVFGGWVEVRRGLFEGDRIVVQGSSLLYGQSLRGGSADPAEDAHGHDHPEDPSLLRRAIAPLRRLPGGLKGPAAIAIAVAFGLGYGLAKRGSRPIPWEPSPPAFAPDPIADPRPDPVALSRQGDRQD
ncbi:MAG: efflux RND transporter periplasmic adaptor subunit [Cyanobacteria bacterium]|nr:efflux RND transporter periplasmic adaptor subunit [Cyanobacteriota bacterium]